MQVGTLGLFALSIAAALAGCGGDGEQKPTHRKPPPAIPTEQRGVLETVDSLQGASRRGDGERICREIFTPKLAKSVAAAAGRSCTKEVKAKLFSPKASLAVGQDIRIDGERAFASVVDQYGNVSKLSLLRQGRGWRIDAVKPGAQSGR